MNKFLKSSVAVAAFAIAGSASAISIYTLNNGGSVLSGGANFGTVKLEQQNGDVQFTINLAPELDFRQNNSGTIFSFNGFGVSLGEINVGTGYNKTSTNVTPSPFGTFQFGITALSQPGSNGGFVKPDPLVFSVSNALESDFLFKSIGQTQAYFAADVACVAVLGNCSGIGVTGNVGATLAPVPEPETYALMFAGLGVVGFMARRRKQQA